MFSTNSVLASLRLGVVLSFLFVDYVSTRCECVHKIALLHSTDDFRIISSPDYPRPYCQNLDCLWKIVAPDNTSKAYFYADNLDLRNPQDRIIFYDHQFSGSENEAESHSCTGDDICRFASSGQYMTIRFRTDHGLIDNYGFQGIVSAKDKPVFALLNAMQTYFIPIIIIGLMILGIFISIACCKRYQPSSLSNHNHLMRHHQEKTKFDQELRPQSPNPRSFKTKKSKFKSSVRHSI